MPYRNTTGVMLVFNTLRHTQIDLESLSSMRSWEVERDSFKDMQIIDADFGVFVII